MSKKSGQVTHLWVAGIVANIASWVVTVLANRELTVTQMGDLGWYVQILTLASISSVSIGIATNRHTVAQKTGPQVAQALYLKALRHGIALAALYVITSPLWQRIFQVSFAPAIVSTSSLLFPIMFVLSWYRGRLQALERFDLAAGSILVEGCVKLALPLIFAGSNNIFAIFVLAQTLSAAVGLAYLYIKAKHVAVRSSGTSQLSKAVVFFVRHLTLQRASLIALLSADVLLAKAFLDPERAGVFAILSLIGKMIYFAGQSMYTIATPLLAPKVSDSKAYARALQQLILMVIILIGGLCVAFVVFPSISLVPLLTESRYAAIADYRLVYSGTSGIFALSFVLSMHHNIKGSYMYTWVYLAALCLLVVSTLWRHDSITDILSNVVLVAILLVAVEIPRLRQFTSR